MAPDPRTMYLDAYNAFIAATAAFTALVDPVNRAAYVFGKSWDVAFGEAPEPRYDLRQVYGQAKERLVVDVSKWPTAEQIKAGVEDCRQRHATMKAAWDSVPEDNRSGSTHPPER